ncbi:MAG TPA: cell division protein ZapB [Geobacteraceae bacterium]
MDQELIGQLAEKVERLLAVYAALKIENNQLREDNERLQEKQRVVASRLDGLLAKLAQVEGL